MDKHGLLPPEMTRRNFLKAASAATVVAGLGIGAKTSRGDRTASAPSTDKIRVGCIGLGGRGSHLMREFLAQPDVVVTALCDVHQARRDEGLEALGRQVPVYKDYRKLLEQSEADAVIVATPPHWHPLISIHAMQAGKDVYCEKPMSLFADESLAMAKTAGKLGRITQLGTQIHSGGNFRRVVEIVRSGVLGKIMNVRTMVTLNESPGRFMGMKNTDPPDGLDWDMWLGPSQKHPFSEALFEAGGHHHFKQFVHSWVNELGPHIMDVAFWAMEPGMPKAVSATGGRFIMEDLSDIPDTVDVLYEYPGFTMTFMNMAGNGHNFGFGGEPDGGRRLAVFFHGTEGTLVTDYSNHQLFLERKKQEEYTPPEKSIPDSPGHVREFLDGIKTRVQPLCNFEYHLPLALALNLGHAALFSGERIGWDAEKERVIGSRKARRLAMTNYRKPWKLPRL